MDSGLVDLSLFAYSPTVDHHYSNVDRVARHHLYASATWPNARNMERACTMKPLPKLPRKNIYDYCIPSTGAKCVLRRIKRVKLDTIRGEHRRQLQSLPSAYAQAPSAYINPNSIAQISSTNETLQERRNPTSPQLTLPQGSSITTSSGLPMVWLPDEQMWLVADPTDPSYGYYATGPDGGEEWLPPYTENDSPASEASASDLSPVREQFRALMDGPRRPPLINPDEPQMSPLFQEALAGVAMLDFSSPSDYSIPNTTTGSAGHRRPHQNSRSTYVAPSAYHSANDSFPPYQSRNDPCVAPRLGRSDVRANVPKPRSESPALRTATNTTNNNSWTAKYADESEIQRQKERMARRRMLVERQPPSRPSYLNDAYGRNFVPYRPSGLSRRESWHSDSTGTVSAVQGPDMIWPIRSSSARH